MSPDRPNSPPTLPLPLLPRPPGGFDPLDAPNVLASNEEPTPENVPVLEEATAEPVSEPSPEPEPEAIGTASPPPPPVVEPPAQPAPAIDPRELARQLAAQAKARLSPDPAPTTRKRSLADRLPQVSTVDPLVAASKAAAREAEPEAPPRKSRKAKSVPPPEEVSPPAPERASEILLQAFPDARVDATVPIVNPVICRALWKAHRARAQADGDPALVAVASVILDALERLPPLALVALRATIRDRSVAVWVDASRGVLLAVVSPPEVYLAGI